MLSSKSESSKAGSDSESESSIPQGPMKSVWNGSLDDAGEEHQEFECVMYWDEEQGCLGKGVRFRDAPFNDYKSLCGTYDWVWNGYPDRDEQVHSYDGSITLELEAHADDLANIHGTITWETSGSQGERLQDAPGVVYPLWYNGGVSGDSILSTDDPDETDGSDSFGVVKFSISTSTEGTSDIKLGDIGGFVNASDSPGVNYDSLQDSILGFLEDRINLKLEFRGIRLANFFYRGYGLYSTLTLGWRCIQNEVNMASDISCVRNRRTTLKLTGVLSIGSIVHPILALEEFFRLADRRILDTYPACISTNDHSGGIESARDKPSQPRRHTDPRVFLVRLHPPQPPPTPVAPEPEEQEDVEGEDEDGDDDKPYCFCQKKSFGDMIACDGPNCPYEWFHLSCVGLKTNQLNEDASWYCDCIWTPILASVDTSKGPVTEEIIKFHLVGDMKTKFNKLVREHGCVLTREEQDLIDKTRKSLISYSSVKVTADAQKAYLAKNPKAQPKGATTEAGPSTTAKEPLQNSNGKRARDDDSVPSGSVDKKAKTT
ncbi:hypothetical protein CPB85DRAFT_1443834 [Mucidula mucida]|nr:hypothetical protein CPB85DRAFT_1443834 [Mucidula mucida]